MSGQYVSHELLAVPLHTGTEIALSPEDRGILYLYQPTEWNVDMCYRNTHEAN